MARECEAAVKCRECNSDRHVSAMHPGPAPWAEGAPVTEQEQGGESEGDVSSKVNSKCTEICGKAPRPKSCSKICLVDVFPSDCPEQAERIYVVLDDQSNQSLAKSAFLSCLVSMEIRIPILYTHVQEQQRQWEEERTISLLGH